MEKVCGLFQKPFLTFQKVLLINTKTKKLKKKKKIASTASPSQTLTLTRAQGLSLRFLPLARSRATASNGQRVSECLLEAAGFWEARW